MVEVNVGQNVGTQAYPESWLHMRTVALLYDEMTKGRSELPLGSRGTNLSEIRVRLTPAGELSGNLMEGVKEVIIPGEWDNVGGVVPDLICRDEDGAPVRIIEVIVTNPPSAEKRRKLDTLKKRGVDVIEVKVKTVEDLLNLCWIPAPFEFASYDPNDVGNLRTYLGPDTTKQDVRELAGKYGGSPGWRSGIGGFYGAPGRETANEAITMLIHALLNCSPGHRRQFLEVCKEIGSMGSLLPLHPLNPLREELTGETEVDIA